MRPLSDWRICAGAGDTAGISDALALLATLGADIDTSGPARPTLSVHPAPRLGWPDVHVRLVAPVLPVPGLPAGVPARAVGALLTLLALAAAPEGHEVRVDPADAVVMLLAPVVLAAAYDAPPPTRPAPLAWADGWLATELGAPGDADVFARLLATLPPRAGVQQVAAEAQLWRVPVVSYRLPTTTTATARSRRGLPGPAARLAPIVTGLTGRGPSPTQTPDRPPGGAWTSGVSHHIHADGIHADGRDGPGRESGPLNGFRVLDASVMWAGPLATWLLAGLGAHVTTIEPSVRPDGTRAPDGGGIYPHGRLVPGARHRSAMFIALARGKQRWDLDLRQPAAQQALLATLADTDLVVDNLSSRARHQLGLDAASLRVANPDLLTVTIPAFARAHPYRAWVAYGSQVHALSGLAWGERPPSRHTLTRHPPTPAATAYADALTGLHAAAVTVAALWGRLAEWQPDGDIEVPLAGSVHGLTPQPGDADRLRADPTPTVLGLLADQPDRFVTVRVDGEDLRHPRHPWPKAVGLGCDTPADGPGHGVEWSRQTEPWRQADPHPGATSPPARESGSQAPLAAAQRRVQQ